MYRLLCISLLTVCIPIAYAADPGKDTLGDPMPEGAKARFGTERLRNLDSYAAGQISPDGKSFISSINGVFQFIDFATGKPTGKFGSGKYPATTISGDGKRLATAGYQSLTILETESGKVISEIKRTTYVSNTLGEISLSWAGKRVAFSGTVDEKKKEDGVSVTVFDIDGKKEIAKIKVAQNSRGYVTLSGDGKTLMTWGYHNEDAKSGERREATAIPSNWIQFWDVETQKELSTLKFNYIPYTKILTKDGLLAITSFGDGVIRFWDTRTGKLKRELMGRSKAGNNLVLSDDEKTLASVCSDGAVQLWNLTDGKSLSITNCPFNPNYFAMQSFRFTGKDSAVILSQIGNTKIAWEIPSGKVLTTLVGHTEGIASLVFTNDDKEIWSTSEAGNTIKWSPDGKELGTVVFKVPGATGTTTGSTISFHSTGAYAIRKESYGNEFFIFDLPSTAQRTFFITAESSYLASAHLSANGQLGAIVTSPGYSDKPKPHKVVYFDMNADIKSSIFELPVGGVNDSKMTLDGKTLVVSRDVKDEKGKAKYLTAAFELPTGKPLGEAELKGYYGGGPRMAIHPDGKSLFTHLEKGDHAVYGLPDMKQERTLKYDKSSGQLMNSTSVVFSLDGNKIAVAYGVVYGTKEVTVRVYDWKSGEITHTFKGHTNNVNAMAFSKDGNTLASGSSDSTVLLWDLSKK